MSDTSADVVVVGCGYAGAVAALCAHDAGAKVTVLEAMPTCGGISVLSGGGVRTAQDDDAAFEYLRTSGGGRTPDEVWRTLARGMSAVSDYVRELADEAGATVAYRQAAANYPFPGAETFGYVSIETLPGFDPRRGYRDVKSLSMEGALLFRVLELALLRRSIPVITSCRAHRLLVDGNGRVAGVEGTHGGGLVQFRAGRGVVLACGGFEANADLQLQYWRGGTAMSAAFLGNVGDGIRMAQAVGADLWHMWHYHGSYGFKDPRGIWPLGIRVKRFPDWIPGVGPRSDVVVSWILVDGAGRRFMSEYPPYLHDTGARDLDHYSFDDCNHPRIPSWMIVDAVGLERYPLGDPLYHGDLAPFDWTADNRSAVEGGILRPANSIEELADVIGAPAAVLRATISRWNTMCRSQVDEDYRRPGSTMAPIGRPPFYAAQVWPVVSNTQGGPRHDHRQRVIDAFGKPIPGLYSAGELGSCFGYLYLSGGNLAECFVGGRIAGQEAAGCREAGAW